jgi:hypothetical protein
MATRNVSNNFIVAGRRIQLHSGTILKEIYLKCLHNSVFLRNKVTP